MAQRHCFQSLRREGSGYPGLKDYIVVDSDDVLLVVSKSEEQNIKNYLEDVKKETQEKYL